MMRYLAVLLLICAIMPAAFAEEDDGVMGLYMGGFTGAWKSDYALRVQVAGQSDRTFHIVLYATKIMGKDEFRLEAKGKREVLGESDGRKTFSPVSIEGEAEFNGAKRAITGKIEDGILIGRLGGEDGTFELARKLITPPSLGMPPTSDAIALLDGTSMDGWVRDPEKFCAQPDGSVQICSSNFRTVQEFGDAEYHIEFMTPYMPNARYQARGNSGVYLMGRYEVQVLDSFGSAPEWDLCGGIYKVAKPLVDAVLPPLTWQTYDIKFIAPRFDENGKKTANAKITVLHNGIVIHDRLELNDVTPGGISSTEAPTGPLMLQDHRDPVRYRNIWVRPLKNE